MQLFRMIFPLLYKLCIQIFLIVCDRRVRFFLYFALSCLIYRVIVSLRNTFMILEKKKSLVSCSRRLQCWNKYVWIKETLKRKRERIRRKIKDKKMKIVTGSDANLCDVFRFLFLPAKQNIPRQRMSPWPHQMEVGLLLTSLRPYCAVPDRGLNTRKLGLFLCLWSPLTKSNSLSSDWWWVADPDL